MAEDKRASEELADSAREIDEAKAAAAEEKRSNPTEKVEEDVGSEQARWRKEGYSR